MKTLTGISKAVYSTREDVEYYPLARAPFASMSGAQSGESWCRKCAS
jgi:hypothetical protein